MMLQVVKTLLSSALSVADDISLEINFSVTVSARTTLGSVSRLIAKTEDFLNEEDALLFLSVEKIN